MEIKREGEEEEKGSGEVRGTMRGGEERRRRRRRRRKGREERERKE